MKTFEGRCHCGRLSLTFSTNADPHGIVPREDSCGFCRRHNAMLITDPEGSLSIHLPADAPQPYRFGLNITDFHVCDRCGVWIAATWSDGDGLRGVVNVPALDDRILFDATPVAVNAGADDKETRESRRRVGWTPARIVTGEAR